MDGVLQETRSGNSQLIDLDLILPLLGTGPGQKPIGFTTSMPFNEIRITYSTVLQLLSILDVYHAFVDGGYAEGCDRSEEHTSELQSRGHLVCLLLLEKKKTKSHSL